MPQSMRNILTLFAFLLLVGTSHAQAPQGIPYQAAARNSSGTILASTSISVRFTIRDSVTTGIIKYRETHSTTTDANGMFSVTVGQGTPVSGTFASINWVTNAKFLQVELDPAGGSTYIDMGTQQMMSVPYALNTGIIKMTVSATGDTLHSGNGNYVIIPGISAANCAVSAGTITGTATFTAGSTTTLSNTTTGGTWSSSNVSIATVGTGGLVSGISAGTASISYTVTSACGIAVAIQIVTVNAVSLTVGATYGGGVIAYIFVSGDPGYIAGETHGLIAAPSDLDGTHDWGCGSIFGGFFLGGTSTALGTGASNTAITSSSCGIYSAARKCADLVLNGYSDWYLPSRDELNKLYINRIYIGGFNTSSYYWSSSEYSADKTWRIYFYSGVAGVLEKYTFTSVRAVRSF